MAAPVVGGGEKNSTFNTGGAARRVSGRCECDGSAMCKHSHIIIMCKYIWELSHSSRFLKWEESKNIFKKMQADTFA